MREFVPREDAEQAVAAAELERDAFREQSVVLGQELAHVHGLLTEANAALLERDKTLASERELRGNAEAAAAEAARYLSAATSDLAAAREEHARTSAGMAGELDNERKAHQATRDQLADKASAEAKARGTLDGLLTSIQREPNKWDIVFHRNGMDDRITGATVSENKVQH